MAKTYAEKFAQACVAAQMAEEGRQVNEKMTRMSGMNDSGLQPVDDKVLVLPDVVGEWVGKDKLLVMAQESIEREQMAQIKATLVAQGGLAFHDWKPPIPQIGDRVLIGKYAGVAKLGKGRKYQMINDRDICAIITEEYQDE